MCAGAAIQKASFIRFAMKEKMARRRSPGCAGGPNRTARSGCTGFVSGATQLLAAAQQPEGLACIAPAMTACDLYHGWFYQNGALRLATTLGWGLQMLKGDARRKQLRDASDRLEAAWANLSAQTRFLPFREHPALHGEDLPEYVLDWFDHDQPGEYWAGLDVSRSFERINARVAPFRLVRHVS